MTKFEKLTQAIENMTGKTIKPEQIKRSKLVMELVFLRQDLGFLQPDIRYKWNQKELIDKIESLQHRISQKEFF